MGLINEYIEIQNKKSKTPSAVSFYIEHQKKAMNPWHQFHQHNTPGEIVSVIAGRQSGKTTNIIQKVLESESEKILWVAIDRALIRVIANRIEGMGHQNVYYERLNDKICVGSKEICVATPGIVCQGNYRGVRSDLVIIEDLRSVSLQAKMIDEQFVSDVNRGAIIYSVGQCPVDDPVRDLFSKKQVYSDLIIEINDRI